MFQTGFLKLKGGSVFLGDLELKDRQEITVNLPGGWRRCSLSLIPSESPAIGYLGNGRLIVMELEDGVWEARYPKTRA